MVRRFAQSWTWLTACTGPRSHKWQSISKLAPDSRLLSYGAGCLRKIMLLNQTSSLRIRVFISGCKLEQDLRPLTSTEVLFATNIFQPSKQVFSGVCVSLQVVLMNLSGTVNLDIDSLLVQSIVWYLMDMLYPKLIYHIAFNFICPHKGKLKLNELTQIF